uniref:Replication protein A subunit n=3 Tax=Parascaris univalens TaxID=6257 RepID=A0A915C2S8_PARUN
SVGCFHLLLAYIFIVFKAKGRSWRMLTVKDLTNDFFQRFLSNDDSCPEKPVLQVLDARPIKNNPTDKRHRFRLSDGVFSYSTCTNQSQIADRVEADKLNEGHPVIRILRYLKQEVPKSDKVPQGKISFAIIDYELLARNLPVLGQPIPHSCNERDYRGLNANAIVQSVNQEQPQGHGRPQHIDRNPRTPNKATSLIGQNLTPIRFITPYVNKWRICGIVTAKEDLRDVKTARGELKVFNFEVTDEEGGCIRIAAFGDTADKFYAIVQKGSMYYISGGTVKQANKRYNTTGHDYELTMRSDTEICPCVDRERIEEPRLNLNVVPLAMVSSRAGQCIDVIAIIDQVSDLQQVTQRSTGALLEKRDLHLIDESGAVVVLTLWGEQARSHNLDLQHQAVGIKGASVREFNGSYSLSALSSTRIEINPDCDESKALYVWYREKRPSIDVKRITVTSMGGDSYARDLRLIGIADNAKLGRNEDKGAYFNVTAMISSMKADGALYKSCGTNGCKKKVVEMDNQYRCEKCNLTLDSFKYVLLLSMELSDFSGCHWVTVFEEKAVKLLGKTAEELGKLVEDNRLDEYNDVFSAVRFREYTFRIRAKSEFYNDAERIKWSVLELNNVDYNKYVEELSKALKVVEQL